MEFRRDIQILRGVAVAMVVLFHFGVPGFHNGYLGVDVFFVISGYLMARLYDPAKKQEFFEKRALRILPAYFCVLLSTILVAAAVVVPGDYAQVKTQSIFASLFASNIGFWAENSYFDKAAFKPLLHLWSLGVEIQFYLLVPLVHWASRFRRFGLPIMFAASAVACAVTLGVSPKTSFFWMPLRLWEFVIGFGVAIYAPKVTQTGKWPWAGLASLCLLIAIALASPVNGEALNFTFGHPGLTALLAAAATGAIIACGLPMSVEQGPIARAFVLTGNYSYSIYLTHFPILVLALYKPFSGTILEISNPAEGVLIAALIAAASIVLHRYIERNTRIIRGRRIWSAGLVAATLTVILAAVVPHYHNRVIPQNHMLIYQAWEDRDVYRCGKIHRIIHPLTASCEITDRIDRPSRRILLIGDSHADSIKSVFASVAQSHNTSVYFIAENSPLTAQGRMTPDLAIQEALSRSADTIVLHYSPKAISADTVKQLSALALERKIRVELVMPVPVWEVHIPTILMQHETAGTALPSQTLANYRAFNEEFLVGITGLPGLKVHDIGSIFCNEKCKIMSDNGRPLYFDRGHLTLTGSEMLRNVFVDIIGAERG